MGSDGVAGGGLAWGEGFGGVGWALLEGVVEVRVVVVEVVEEGDLPVVVGEGGEVVDVDGEGGFEADGLVVRVLVVEGIVDGVEVPGVVGFGIVLAGKDPGGELVGVLDADAAVGEVAALAGEEADLRGGVEVDVVLVGEHELDEAEGVGGSGLLADEEEAVLESVGGVVGDGFSRAVADFVAFVFEVVVVGFDVVDELFFDDGDGDVPVWAEDDVLHHVGEDRCVVVALDLADDDAHGPFEVVAVFGGGVAAEDELGEVYEEAGLEVGVGEPSPALEGVLELGDAGGHGDVEAADGGGAEFAVGLEAVALLVGLDGVGVGLGEDGFGSTGRCVFVAVVGSGDLCAGKAAEREVAIPLQCEAAVEGVDRGEMAADPELSRWDRDGDHRALRVLLFGEVLVAVERV